MDQLWKQYRETGIIPVIGAALGRPKKPITAEESGVIETAFERFRYGARMLEMLIWKDFTVSISHNRIHRYLMDRGLAKAERSKRKQRKWVRYERKHSMSAGHIDWHEDPVSGLKRSVRSWMTRHQRSWQSGSLLPLILRIQLRLPMR